jgi:rhamnogalacturonyl hydrolase YesR
MTKSPREVTEELLAVYGRKYDKPSYIPALALVARLRFGDLTDDATQQTMVEGMLDKPWPVPKGGPEFAGFLAHAALAQTEGSPIRAAMREAVRGANETMFADEGLNQVKLPGDTAMSDAVFMHPPMLCEAGAILDDPRYFAAAVKYQQAMIALRMREDGLYRHGHRCDAAWGRGNGFPAVGMAWCLSLLPTDQPSRNELLAAFQKHMAALLAHQDENGMWHQVIDMPESYAEFSCTAMIGFAMERGVVRGWLDAERYQPAADRAWQAIVARIEPMGRIIDVCEGTGTQATLDDYLKRRAIRGQDDRGGAMALLFATERMAHGR